MRCFSSAEEERCAARTLIATGIKSSSLRSFLQARGYRVGRATIEASDWAIDARLEKRTETEPHADLTGYRDFFLQHIRERAQFYDSLSRHILGRPLRHTVP
jgi:hypothetical protein